VLRGKTCLADQKAVSAVSGSVRVSATNANGAPRLCRVLRFVSFMASLSWAVSLGPSRPSSGLGTNLWPEGRLGRPRSCGANASRGASTVLGGRLVWRRDRWLLLLWTTPRQQYVLERSVHAALRRRSDYQYLWLHSSSQAYDLLYGILGDASHSNGCFGAPERLGV